MHKLISIVFLFSLLPTNAQSKRPTLKTKQQYIAVKVYHATDQQQLDIIGHYLQTTLLPALKKDGFNNTGAFEAIDNDTAKDKRMYVFIPFTSLQKFDVINNVTNKSISDSLNSADYIKAPYNRPAYARLETILLYTFEARPGINPSPFKRNKDAVYEFRSYESASEALHQNKVKMFNSGEEDIFDRLAFHPVFFSQVIAGSRMPNLMYLTSFENKAARDEHWKKFSSDPAWKTMSSKAEYQNNVSHIDIVFLRSLPYSAL